MKKPVLSFLMLFAVTVAAQAQITVGISSGFNTIGSTVKSPNNYWFDASNGNSYAYYLSPSLNLGYQLSNNIAIGLTGGIVYYCEGESVDADIASLTQYNRADIHTASENLSWNAGVFARYNMHLIGNLSLFAHLKVDFGSVYYRWVDDWLDYQGQISRTTTESYGAITYFSEAILTPGISYRFNSHLSADIYLNLLHIAYIHSTIKDDDDRNYYGQLSFGLQSLLINPLNMFNGDLSDYPFLFNPSLQPGLSFGINYTF